VKLERVWSKIVKQTPSGLQFGSDPTYDELVRSYEDILGALPKIDGWKPERLPMDLNAIGQTRLDAEEIGEISAEIAVEEDIEAPGRELFKYRHLLNKKRRQLIRSAMSDMITAVDEMLLSLNKSVPKRPRKASNIGSALWERLRQQIQEIDTLLGSALTRPLRWSDLQRHLHFGLMQDLLDILRLDWPEVKSDLQKSI
jgi:hypothetical protein